jgi:hypothetical protein
VCFLIHTRRPLPSFPVDVSLLLGELFGSCFSSGYHYAEGLCVAHNTQACQQSIILGDVLLLHTAAAAADTPFFIQQQQQCCLHIIVVVVVVVLAQQEGISTYLSI